MEDYQRLNAIGYQVTPRSAKGPLEIINPDGSRVSNPAAELRLAHMAGRLNNLAYLAHWIDLLLGIPEDQAAPIVPGGREQFNHMAEDHRMGLRVTLLIYIALRQQQIEGNLPALRAGLSILLAYDHNEIGEDDALLALWGARPRPEVKQLSAPAPAIAG